MMMFGWASVLGGDRLAVPVRGMQSERIGVGALRGAGATIAVSERIAMDWWRARSVPRMRTGDAVRG
jgi:hypothetical protein